MGIQIEIMPNTCVKPQANMKNENSHIIGLCSMTNGETFCH